jgi:APA family basic amino acid/polyamine antiporter
VGMSAIVIAFGAGSIAKLASAFVLVTLGLVNLAVIVLRFSQISSYAPGFKAPLFPVLQLFGIALAVYLIITLGWFPMVMVSASIFGTLLWFAWFGKERATQPGGAVLQIFERWGRGADSAIDRELSQAMQSHGLRSDDDYVGLIARASVVWVPEGGGITEAALRAAQVLGNRMDIEPEQVTNRFLESGSLWIQPSQSHPTATPVAFFDVTEDDHLVIAVSPDGVVIPADWGGRNEKVKTLFFLAGTTSKPGRALRLAGELAAYLHSSSAAGIATAGFESEVKQPLLPALEIGQYALLPEMEIGALIGRKIGDLELEDGLQAEAIRRGGKVIRATNDLVLESDDQLTLIGPVGELPEGDELVNRLTGDESPTATS